MVAPSANDQLASENWGTLIQSLRDKIAHQDRIRPNFSSGEKLLDRVSFNWPTLRGMTFDPFCQFMENRIFFMMTEISSLCMIWNGNPART